MAWYWEGTEVDRVERGEEDGEGRGSAGEVARGGQGCRGWSGGGERGGGCRYGGKGVERSLVRLAEEWRKCGGVEIP